jgi:hypothetical protein
MIEKNEAMGAVVVEKMRRGGDTLWKGDLAAALLRDFDASGSLSNSIWRSDPYQHEELLRTVRVLPRAICPPRIPYLNLEKIAWRPAILHPWGDVFFAVRLIIVFWRALSREVAAQR